MRLASLKRVNAYIQSPSKGLSGFACGLWKRGRREPLRQIARPEGLTLNRSR